MNITLENIKAYANDSVYKKGVRLYKQSKVELLETGLVQFKATVENDETHNVQVEQENGKFYSSCTCPSWGTCEHVIAALLEAKTWYNENQENLIQLQSQPQWKSFFDQVIESQIYSLPNNEDNSMQKWKIVFIIQFDNESWSLTPQKAYVKKDGSIGRFANIGEFDPNSKELLYAENDPIIISYLQKLEQQQNSFYNYRYYGNNHDYDISSFHFKYGSKLGPLFDFLQNSTLLLKTNDNTSPIEFGKTCSIHFEFENTNEHYSLSPVISRGQKVEKLNPEYHILSEQPVWIIRKNKIYKIDNQEYSGLLLPFSKDAIDLQIPKSEFPDFLENIYPQLSLFSSIPLPDSVPVKHQNSISNCVLTLKETEDYLEITPSFNYGGHLIDPNESQFNIFRKEDETVTLISRDIKNENRILESLLKSGLKTSPRGPLRLINSKVLKWMFKNIPHLREKGFVLDGIDELENFRIRTGEPNVRMAVTTKIDWFDLNIEIDIEGVSLALSELRRAVKQNKKYVRLEDNSIAKLPEEWFKKFKHLFNFSHSDDQEIQVAKYHVTLIDSLFEDAEGKIVDEEYNFNLERLQGFKGIEQQELPTSLNSVMRDYQKAGFDWLYFLKEYNFGGCLADDMGLGKTLQTLSLLLKEKKLGNNKSSLIVCPTSVVFNWEQEIKKFTPELNVLVHTGNYRQRNIDGFEEYDIILTSYGIMRRDVTFLRDLDFHYIVLDESQKIKNPQSQTAKAVRILNSRYKLVLTGTPVENNTIELWSQFSFLNPGLLGPLPYFKSFFTNPIEKKQDTETAALLKQLIYPFILRRTKENVATELPPKIEQTVFCSMNPEQQQLYQYWKNYYRSMILEKIDTVGIDKARMNILEGLVKLRQIACHPHLIDNNVNEDSGKFEYLKESIEEIIAEDHKILLFSQFVRMLKLLQAHLDEVGIPYVYLDGNTRNRQECVERFQNDKNIKIFLISLKAGGTGLNLTEADYVIHYDPWWNPAVEVQATDRAHRIGQEKKVFVYRLITKESVEEKMLTLQDKKKKLVSDLITTDSGFFKSLTRENVEMLFA